MKRIYAIMMMAAALAACSQEELPQITEEPEVPTYTMNIEATKGEEQGEDVSTRALTLSGKTLNATWATTEHVYVQKGSTWASGSLQPQTAGTSTTLKGTLSGVTIAAGDDLTLQFPRSGDRDYTGQVGTLADIAAKYDYATATVKVASISGAGNINPVAATTTFTNQQAIVKFTLKNKATDAALSATQLVVSDGTNTYTVTPASAASEIYVALPGFSGKTVSLTATVGSDTYAYEKSGVTFTNGQYYEITVKMKLLGKFSVSSTKQVYFSPGNLQAVFAEANTSSCTWQFAPTQYSCIGNATANTAVGNNVVTTAGTVDLFGWVGANSSLAAYGINNNTTYLNYGNTTNEALKSDWSVVANAANLGGHNDWRTLAKAEWVYVFQTRTNASQKYGHGSVNGVNGMIILPDGWVLPSGLSFTAGNSAWTNSYTTAQWEKMEENGAVFLPAAGYRNGTSVSNVGFYASYWSSTSHESKASNAYYVLFNSGSLFPQNHIIRNYGSSVRLVRDI